jgi:hypothetical protein
MPLAGPGEFAGGTEGGKTIVKSVIHRAHQHVHHDLRLELIVRQIDLIFSVDLQGAPTESVVGVDAEEAEVKDKPLGNVRFLGAEAALMPAESVGDVRSEDFAQSIFCAVKDAGVIAVVELEEGRMSQHR